MRWCGLAVLLAVAGSCGAAPEPDEPPDLVLIVIDTLRPDHLDLYGYERETAPFLTQLAERSTVFEHAYSTSSWTAPSTASIFTGMYPNRHGVLMGFRAQRNTAEAEADEELEALELVTLPALPTLVEQLRAAGYGTFGVASNINIGEQLGFDRGFDRFERMIKDDAEVLAQRVLSWREELDAGPSFLYLHFNDVHKPYHARDPWYAEHEDDLEDLVARYDSEITYLDGWIEHLHDELGWDEDTVVMLVSDHGEEFRDHGKLGHGYSLYRELNQVLMMIALPGALASRVDAHVSLVDVLPTLLDAAGFQPFEYAQGTSLLPLVRGDTEAEFERRTLFAHRIRGKDPAPLYERKPVWSAIRGRWKLIRRDREAGIELYDLHEDPGELRDLAGERPELVEELSHALATFEERTERLEGERVEVQVDSELFEHLRELGYADDTD